MNFQGAETILRISTWKAMRAYQREREYLHQRTDSYWKGYVDSYIDSSFFNRLLGFGSLTRNSIRYQVATDLLEESELESMDEDDLTNEASVRLGWFASSRRVSRKNKAENLLKKRARRSR